MERIGLEKLRGEVTRHLNTLRCGPHIRSQQIDICRMLVRAQDEIDRRNEELRQRKRAKPDPFGYVSLHGGGKVPAQMVKEPAPAGGEGELDAWKH